MDYFNTKYIFQPLIFRGHVSFPGIYFWVLENFQSFEFQVDSFGWDILEAKKP